MIKLCITRF